MESFGDAGVPAFQFDLRLRFGYYATVAVWETRKLAKIAANYGHSAHTYDGFAITDPPQRRGRRYGVIHLSRPALNDDTLVHELWHLLYEFAEETRKRFRNEDAHDEAMAQEMERCFVAAKSHINEEKKRAF
jgi:hypothetical protein